MLGLAAMKSEMLNIPFGTDEIRFTVKQRQYG